MKERKIKFMTIVRKWVDRVKGNTYHSVQVVRCRDGSTIVVPFRYGHGEHYKQTALAAMAHAKWLPVKYRPIDSQFGYERENNYPILWTVSHGLKRDCIANGQL